MKKGEVISLVRNILTSGGMDANDSRVHPKVICAYLDVCLAQLMGEYLKASSDVGSFLSTFTNVEVKLDDSRDERYVDLPAPIINIEGALHTVAPMKDRKNPFPVVDAGEISIFCNSDVATCLPLAYLEDEKIFLYGATRHQKTVMIRMLASSTALEDDDHIKVPEGREKDVIDMILETMSLQFQYSEDDVNDTSAE